MLSEADDTAEYESISAPLAWIDEGVGIEKG
jgi:hypothetical protein